MTDTNQLRYMLREEIKQAIREETRQLLREEVPQATERALKPVRDQLGRLVHAVEALERAVNRRAS